MSNVELGVQTERAFQKQPLFLNAKATGTKKVSSRTRRWYKDVGLGFKTPRAAIDGNYIGESREFTSGTGAETHTSGMLPLQTRSARGQVSSRSVVVF
jgi:Ribosomal_S17 N-terminal